MRIRAQKTIGNVSLALCALLALASAADPRHADAQNKRRAGRRAPAVEPAAPPPASDAPVDPPAAPAGDTAASPLAITPAPAEPAPATPPPAAEPPEPEVDAAEETAKQDAQAVREELSGVMDSLVSARARAALLGKSLFKTRVRVQLINDAAGDQLLGKVALALDGNPIYRGEGGSLDPEGAKLFEGYAAPGPHVLTVEIEQRAREDDAYRYSQTSSLRFVVPRGTLTDLTLVLDDDSDIAEDFKDDDEGEYDVRLRLEVEARPLEGS